MRSVALRCLPIVVWVASSGPAGAQAVDRALFAQERFSKGVALYDRGEHAAALEEFRASYELRASPNSRLYMARCLHQLGRLADSVIEYGFAVREAADRSAADPRYRETETAARTELALVEPQVARLTIRVQPLPPSTAVRLNERVIPRDGLGLSIPVEPGRIRIEITASGYESISRHLEARAGQALLTEVMLRPISATPTELAKSSERPRSTPSRTWTWVAFGVGAAGLASFATFGLLARSQHSELADRCGSVACPEEDADDIRRGRRYQLAANVSLGIGIVGAALGALLAYRDGVHR